MKAKIAMLLAGLVLGTAGTAGAATHGWFSHNEAGYQCYGDGGGATCKLKYTPLTASISPRLGVWLSINGKPMLSCDRTALSKWDCDDYR